MWDPLDVFRLAPQTFSCRSPLKSVLAYIPSDFCVLKSASAGFSYFLNRENSLATPGGVYLHPCAVFLFALSSSGELFPLGMASSFLLGAYLGHDRLQELLVFSWFFVLASDAGVGVSCPTVHERLTPSVIAMPGFLGRFRQTPCSPLLFLTQQHKI